MSPKSRRTPAASDPGDTWVQRPRRRATPLGFLGHAATFLGASVLGGVLLAGVILPAAGAVGLGAKNGAEGFESIPDDFKTPPLTQATQIFDAKGGLIAKVYERDRTVIPADQMSPLIRTAQVDIEDARFYEHGAVDLKGVLRAITKNAESGAAVQGASTLTQQYVKNVNVEKAGDDPDAVREAQRKTLGRKIQELRYAIKLEEDLTKEQILTNYLNITFYGHQAYGIQAASQRYFSKDAKDLSLPEAAMLAGLVQNPSQYDPKLHPVAAQKRRDTVIDKMVENKHITADQAREAKAAPLGLDYKDPRNGCITAKAGMGFFCDYVRHVVKQDPEFGKNSADRKKLWDTGGLNIYTTLDPDKQTAAQNSVSTKVYVTDPVSAAMTMVEPGSGKILAMAQTRPYGLAKEKNETVVNYNVDAGMGGGIGFQPGSNFKPIVAAAALEAGLPPTQRYDSPNRMDWPTMKTCDGTWKNLSKGKKEGTIPNESTSEVGPYDLKQAMAMSVNTYFVQMEQEIGLCAVKQMANKLGVTGKASGDPLQELPALGLGTQEVSPLTMANVYATFAARGTYCAPLAINRITTVDGADVPVPPARCTPAMSEDTADVINSVLLGVTEKGGTARDLGLDDNRQIAGKTGTTDEKKSAWFTGYTGNLAGSVWLGSPGTKVPMRNIRIGGRYQAEVFGATGPGPIWQQAMSDAVRGMPEKEFTTVYIPDPPRRDGNCTTSSGSPTPAGCTGAPTTGGQGNTGKPRGTSPTGRSAPPTTQPGTADSPSPEDR
ncbi:transglycosylase domain-containing protein [Streptomyces sp. CBMA156]|uniref:transglycosylase domain-containing protein n=1 Tax=Streptomyces sp. CBMA156 TaxID=1930280 RepID=UPI001CB7C2DA|nr:transglycosylase domain-containing protein [Streptomyces sp. CBMA156]MBD0674432.1 penicillin-binding protein [Streptomyces sp. CBMA156]